jgi:uncharacterized membrane protein YfcA
MPESLAWLLFALSSLTFAFVAGWIWLTRQARVHSKPRGREAVRSAQPTPLQIGIGAVTNFFDALGIGSFATTTSIYRLKGIVADELLPGTLNTGHTLPSIAQALIFLTIIEVDVTTLIAMIAAAVGGAWLGAGVVSRWPPRKIQVGMGGALLAAATVMFMTQLDLFPLGGDALGVRGAQLAVAIIGNFILGALMTLGIGLYAPCMILVSLLGMNPRAAFPIMMSSCAFLMPVGSLRFIRERRYDLQAAIGLTLGGVPGVLLAAFVVKSLPLGAVRWLVICVVVYTATMMLRSARAGRAMTSKATGGNSKIRAREVPERLN